MQPTIEEVRLSDGSISHNVILHESLLFDIVIGCVDAEQAEKVRAALDQTAWISIEHR